MKIMIIIFMAADNGKRICFLVSRELFRKRRERGLKQSECRDVRIEF